MIDRIQHIDASRLSRRSFVLMSAAALTGTALRLQRPVGVVEAKEKTPKEVKIAQFSSSGQPEGELTVPMMVKSDGEWKQLLSPAAFEITRRAGTEYPYSGQWNLHDKGLYRCVCCDTACFNSNTKYDSGTGWPSFWQPIAKENIRESGDLTMGMERTALSCRRCDAHLGHVFDDGPQPTGLRYCMNSVAFRFVKMT